MEADPLPPTATAGDISGDATAGDSPDAAAVADGTAAAAVGSVAELGAAITPGEAAAAGDSLDAAAAAGPTATAEELTLVVDVLRRVGLDQEFYKSTACRPLRKALQPFVEAIRKGMYGGGTLGEYSTKQARTRSS